MVCGSECTTPSLMKGKIVSLRYMRLQVHDESRDKMQVIVCKRECMSVIDCGNDGKRLYRK